MCCARHFVWALLRRNITASSVADKWVNSLFNSFTVMKPTASHKENSTGTAGGLSHREALLYFIYSSITSVLSGLPHIKNQQLFIDI